MREKILVEKLTDVRKRGVERRQRKIDNETKLEQLVRKRQCIFPLTVDFS